MPSRRSLLAASGTTVATALAGCSVLAGGPEGSPANVEEHRDLRPEDGEVVARTTAERVGCPRGDVEVSHTAYEAESDGDLQAVTTVAVRPGARGCDDSDWRHDGVDVTQAWRLDSGSDAAVTGAETNVAYADTDDPEVSLQDTGNSERGEWRVRRASDDGDVRERYAFRSTYAGAAAEPGDELVAVTVAVPFSTGGLLGGESETVTLSETLVYGEREE
jgi:hypothetical protein